MNGVLTSFSFPRGALPYPQVSRPSPEAQSYFGLPWSFPCEKVVKVRGFLRPLVCSYFGPIP